VLGSDIKNIHAAFGINQRGGSVARHIKAFEKGMEKIAAA
jgi:hypothetical protein